ncbi:MAG: hypothetical protein L6R40_008079 [Gallowayella cf. fulva]|nr:MAG: hypothetical protein L6R40_008079 [Xanthomendoza cf. fulva]
MKFLGPSYPQRLPPLTRAPTPDPTPWSDASTFSLEVSPRNKILTALRPTIKSPVETVHWSDIAFAIWEATALTTHTPPQHLHFLAQQNNTNFLTHKVINRIVEGKPGEIKMFGQGTAIFHALLATDMGSRAVYFLMEHKRQLGHKTIAMVTVFGKTQAQWLQNGPDIVFELKDVAPAPDASARANGTFSAETEKLCQSIERQWGGEDADFLKRSESVLQNTE